MAVDSAVHHVDALDAQRRRGVRIGQIANRRVVLPVVFAQQHAARRARGEHDVSAFTGTRTRIAIRGLDGRHVDAEAGLEVVARLLRVGQRARGDRHRHAFLGQHHRSALTDRSGAGQDDRAQAGELPARALEQARHAGRRGGVGAVAVEHHRHAKVGEELAAHRLEQRLARGQVAAADEQRGGLLVLGRAREDGAFDQRADVRRVDAAVRHYMVGAAVIGHHGVEDGRDRVGVELEQELFHGGPRNAIRFTAARISSADAAARRSQNTRCCRSADRPGAASRRQTPTPHAA